MEQLTKRILAIVLIAVIGTGVGVGAWYFLSQEQVIPWETPGVTGIPSNRWIKIGVLNDIGEIQGDHAYQGAWLAAYNINTAGGIDINGTTYYVAIIAEDTEEANPQLDVTKGVAAAQKIIHVDGAKFLLGGFRTEALKSYIEVIMDNKKVFLDTGAATDSFCENVVDGYSRYKYFFRVNPHNSSAMGKQIIYFMIVAAFYRIPLQAYIQGIGAAPTDPYYGTGIPGQLNSLNISKVAILREDLDWTIPFAAAIKGYMPFPPANVMEIAYPITATSEDFTTYINQIQAFGAQICIPIISGQGGIKMTTAYKDIHPNFLLLGVDVQAQTSEYWTDTLGGCAYEVYSHGFAGLNNTNVTPLTQAFYDQYWDVWGHAPLYTGTGSYDAVNLYAQVIESTQSLRQTDLISALEAIDLSSPNVNTSVTTQKFAFTSIAQGYSGAHDVVADFPFASIAYGQWHPDGKQYCVPASGIPTYTIYPDWLSTGSLLLPPWGITGLVNL
ncbi:MAG: ABC transporter substrate-binding protein [Candidatus Odinarchaeota archaeon]